MDRKDKLFVINEVILILIFIFCEQEATKLKRSLTSYRAV